MVYRRTKESIGMNIIGWVLVFQCVVSWYIHTYISYSLLFKGNQKDAVVKPEPAPRKKPQKESLLDTTRSQNVAIAKRKLNMSTDEIGQAISLYVKFC